MNWDALTQKKVAGIPVLYLAGGGVLVLAVVAWRIKPAPGIPEDEVQDAGPAEGEAVETAGDYVPPFVANAAPAYGGGGGAALPDPNATAAPDDNDRWMRRSIEWLAGQGHATADVATIALQKYLSGDQLSVAEGQLRDMAIAQFGLPPEIPPSGGTAPPPPPVKANVPPGYHTVTGKTDDGYQEIAALWYGNASNDRVDLIQAHNTHLPHQGPLPVGTRVWIPAYTPPKYVTAKKGMLTVSEILAKNPPLTKAMLMELNDGLKFPVKSGTKIRVA